MEGGVSNEVGTVDMKLLLINRRLYALEKERDVDREMETEKRILLYPMTSSALSGPLPAD